MFVGAYAANSRCTSKLSCKLSRSLCLSQRSNAGHQCFFPPQGDEQPMKARMGMQLMHNARSENTCESSSLCLDLSRGTLQMTVCIPTNPMIFVQTFGKKKIYTNFIRFVTIFGVASFASHSSCTLRFLDVSGWASPSRISVDSRSFLQMSRNTISSLVCGDKR
jgi:hypothetical protein